MIRERETLNRAEKWLLKRLLKKHQSGLISWDKWAEKQEKFLVSDLEVDMK